MSEPVQKIEIPTPMAKFHPHTYREVAFTGYRELPPLLYKIRVSMAQGPKIPNADADAESADGNKKKLMKYALIAAALYFGINFMFPSDPPANGPDNGVPAETAPASAE